MRSAGYLSAIFNSAGHDLSPCCSNAYLTRNDLMAAAVFGPAYEPHAVPFDVLQMVGRAYALQAWSTGSGGRTVGYVRRARLQRIP